MEIDPAYTPATAHEDLQGTLMPDDFKPGDIVASTVSGYFKGVPGRIVGPAPVQFGDSRRYVIMLEGTGERLVLAARYIRHCKDRPRVV